MVLDSGATAWVLASTALVMLMTPGVGLFYGGLCRKKNLISIIALSFVALAIVSVQWVLFGYSLAFGTDIGGFIGGLEFAGLNGIGMESSSHAPAIPSLLFMAFQLMFAAVTMAIVISGMAERVKLSSFAVLALLWTTLVYDPLAHWVWGGGWAMRMGALDFAGGTVVHISAGFAALAIALVIGKRSGFGKYAMEPSNIPLVLLGAALLWFGWFGFNAGSALAAEGLAANALVVTNTSAAAGALSWLLVSWAKGKPSSIGIAGGAVAGLVAITPAAGFVGPLEAILIGAVAGAACFFAVAMRTRSGLDESLDAWAVHGVGGLWGALATGLLATLAVNKFSGLVHGNANQFFVNALGAFGAMAYAFIVTLVLAVAVDKAMGLRVSEDEEYVGMDLAVHGERA
ncbi:MAG: ammonium transporter [Candidatus ainarchaeum sp.]|nr:ammonium transporter [Candidatus ainarchaeum sp.]